MGPPHGTRSRYTQKKCRCDACREANRLYYHQRLSRAAAIAATIPEEKWVAQKWTTVDGFKEVRFYKRKCPGLTKKGCPTRSHLRKDSKGGLCMRCRERAISTHLWASADASREKLIALSQAGIGTDQVMALTGLAKSTLQELRRGKKGRVTPETERKILSIKPSLKTMANGALVPAKETWDKIRWMLKKGITKTEIAARLGSKAKRPALQLEKKLVTAANARGVAVFYEEVKSSFDTLARCEECETDHSKKARLEAVGDVFPISPQELQEKFPCFYKAAGKQQNSKESMKLARDMKDLGAHYDQKTGLWDRPRDTHANLPRRDHRQRRTEA